MYRPLRSVMYSPGGNERALSKAPGMACDAVICDLEDSVAPGAKVEARERVCALVSSGDFGRKVVTIRVNGSGTDWYEADLAAAVAAGPDAIVVPKVNSATEAVGHAGRLDALGAPAAMQLWPMIETPQAVLEAAGIASCHRRVGALVMGTNDLIAELAACSTPDRFALVPSLAQAVLAARAAGIAAIDGVFNAVKDLDGLASEAKQGRIMGFDGKTLIHPSHIGPCHEQFSPSSRDIEDAHDVIAAWDAACGAGVATVNGRMIEQLHVDAAHRILAIAEAVDAESGG